MDDPLLKILIVFSFVLLNAFFVAAEFAIVKAKRSKFEELAKQGRQRARIALRVLDDIDTYLSACQLGITIASLGLGWVGEPFVARMLLPVFRFFGIHSEAALHTMAFIVGFSIITFLHIVLGEMAPKSFAIRRSFGIALNSAPPLRLFYMVLYPFISVLNGSAMLILRAFGIADAGSIEHVVTEEDIRALINGSHENGEFTRHESQMLEKVLDFHDLEAHQILVPRTEIVFLSVKSDAEQNLRVAEKCGHTRFPLCEESIDDVVGFVHIKDLYRAVREADGPVDLRDLKREILFFPEHTRLDRILREFQQKRVHLAIVLDEYGGTLGMLTLEDVIEELVGEIQDEFDKEIPDLRAVGPDEFLLEGGCPVPLFEDVTGAKLPETEADTVAGVFLDTMGDFPKVGDRMVLDGGVLVVRGVKDQRITRMRFTRAR